MRQGVTKVLRAALTSLEAERVRIEQQIAGIRSALDAVGQRGAAPRTMGAGRRRNIAGAGAPRSSRRRRMSRAARAAASERMRAYWAKRRAESGKSKGKKAA